MRLATVALCLGLAVATAACGDDESSGSSSTATRPDPTEVVGTPVPAADQRYPDVVSAMVEADGEGTFHVSATVSSPYDTPGRYADAWRVVTPDGTVLATRELLHDHAAEQPFTRSLNAVEIPEDVAEVVIEGRDSENGWGGATVTVAVPGHP